VALLQNDHNFLMLGQILWYKLNNGKETRDLVHGMWGACTGQVHLTTVARELGMYKLALVGVQEVRCDTGSTVRAGDYIFFLWERKWKSSVRNRIFGTPWKSNTN